MVQLIGCLPRSVSVSALVVVSPAVDDIPIPKISAARQRPFVRLFDRILAAKASNPSADTRELEGEIDRLVYGLYVLMDTEVTAVGGV